MQIPKQSDTLLTEAKCVDERHPLVAPSIQGFEQLNQLFFHLFPDPLFVFSCGSGFGILTDGFSSRNLLNALYT